MSKSLEDTSAYNKTANSFTCGHIRKGQEKDEQWNDIKCKRNNVFFLKRISYSYDSSIFLFCYCESFSKIVIQYIVFKIFPLGLRKVQSSNNSQSINLLVQG